MTETEKQKLEQLLQITYPEVDTSLISRIVGINQDLSFEEAKRQSEILILQRLILELDEKVKLGEMETQNIQKLQILREKLQQLQKQTKKARIITLE